MPRDMGWLQAMPARSGSANRAIKSLIEIEFANCLLRTAAFFLLVSFR